jgi:ubiquinone/menaquinone biosynthesis C-methylase UbiE
MSDVRHDVARHLNGTAGANKRGLLLHSAARYDMLVWLVTRGRDRALRERTVSLARLAPGEAVLDVGCGTGSLALAVKRRVGPAGTVCGIDPSPEMLACARRKAERAGMDIAFENGWAQELPFGACHFDCVLATVMLHHLPRPAREAAAGEMRRVLKPGGRVLAIDFAKPRRMRKGHFARFHRHGHVDLPDLEALLRGAGLSIVKSGAVGMNGLQFVLATTPAA